MAFPVVEATNTSAETSDTTSHTVALPASIASGELLIVVYGYPAGGFPQTPSGWTASEFVNHSTETTVTNIAVFTRTADGGEGSTLAVTTNNSRKSAHASYRISGWDSFEFSADAESVGTGDADPPSLTPSGGADDYLWLAMCGSELATIDSAPTNYGNFLNPSAGTTLGYPKLGVAERSLNASTEDPGTFDLSSAQHWVASTMAVFPSAGTGPSAPTDVVASNPTSTTIDLDWTDTNGATAFPNMYRRTPAGSGDWTFVEQLAASATSYTFTGLASGTEYDLGVSYSDS